MNLEGPFVVRACMFCLLLLHCFDAVGWAPAKVPHPGRNLCADLPMHLLALHCSALRCVVPAVGSCFRPSTLISSPAFGSVPPFLPSSLTPHASLTPLLLLPFSFGVDADVYLAHDACCAPSWVSLDGRTCMYKCVCGCRRNKHLPRVLIS